MSFQNTVRAAFAAVFIAAPALAGPVTVEDPYIRSSAPTAPTGAAFMMLQNAGAQDDRLIGARSDIAAKVEIHTHVQDANGVMKMRAVEGGLPVPAGQVISLKRGGDHIMFMGLNRALEDGDTITLILEFEAAGDVTVDVPVDRTR